MDSVKLQEGWLSSQIQETKRQIAQLPEWLGGAGRLSAQVLVYDARLTHSTWQDFRHQCRTVEGLKKQLRRGAKRGDWVGWRLITIHEEVLGNQ